ncbi:MAG TPA: branched-chain amino acid ABC transporter permease [Acidimicrobiales bacterium]|jgi:branched-chain amino acid transport system permease protein|nr:branched-chain amino acid ABC transporter permease [Acidimicrobiales bacterium]
MQLFFDQVLNGIGTGAVYSSVALALVIIYRTTGLLNFAQGEMALFSTFVTWWLTDQGLGIWPALLGSMVFSFFAGALIERVIIRPVEAAKNPLNVVIVTLGLFLALNALCQLIFIKPGQEALQMPLMFPKGDISVLGLDIPKAILGRAIVLAIECAVLYVLLQKTKIGLALRAVASNPESSRLVGINPGNMLMLGWGIAAVLGAIAGTMAASRGTGGFDTSLMQQVLVYAFAAAALGGFDSPVGAVISGLIVGIARALTIQYVDFLQGIELVVPLGLIFIVLLFKPNGLFGRNIVERV